MKTARFFTLFMLSLGLLLGLSCDVVWAGERDGKDTLRHERRHERHHEKHYERRRAARQRHHKAEPTLLDSVLVEGRLTAVGADGRIGLALEGGGARGLYHIGVIKA